MLERTDKHAALGLPEKVTAEAERHRPGAPRSKRMRLRPFAIPRFDEEERDWEDWSAFLRGRFNAASRN